MKEFVLHHIWKKKNLDFKNLKTYHGSFVEIINFGKQNFDAGPDFYNAEIVIDNQLWIGCVEMHINSSDWDLHQHSKDSAYNNVILHVVWNHDKEIDFLRNRNVETLILKDYVSEDILTNYHTLILNNKNEIVCENLLQNVDWEKINFWFNGLLIERLQQKSEQVLNLYEKSNHNWEEVTFKLFASNFGLKVNQEAFEIWSNSFPYKVLQKVQHQNILVEALFFGQAGFLNNPKDEYSNSLTKEYDHLKNKFKLEGIDSSIFKFSSIRPLGFPTIRLAQLSSIYSTEKQLFSKLLNLKTKEDFIIYFQQFEVNDYWKNHYVFGKESSKSSKILSQEKIINLIINTIIPLRFSYDLTLDNLNLDFYIDLLESLNAEKNSITTKFKEAKFKIKTAKDSQVLLHLKKYYCDEKKCLNCALGNEVLKQ